MDDNTLNFLKGYGTFAGTYGALVPAIYFILSRGKKYRQAKRLLKKINFPFIRHADGFGAKVWDAKESLKFRNLIIAETTGAVPAYPASCLVLKKLQQDESENVNQESTSAPLPAVKPEAPKPTPAPLPAVKPEAPKPTPAPKLSARDVLSHGGTQALLGALLGGFFKPSGSGVGGYLGTAAGGGLGAFGGKYLGNYLSDKFKTTGTTNNLVEFGTPLVTSLLGATLARQLVKKYREDNQ